MKSVSWSPSGQLLSIGSYDEKLRILNHMTWKTLAEHDHTQTKVDGRSVDIYREHTFYDGETERTRYAVEDSMVVVPTETPDPTKPFPKLGVGMQAWSSDSALLFTRNDSAPTALWVWETVRSLLHALALDFDLAQPRLTCCASWAVDVANEARRRSACAPCFCMMIQSRMSLGTQLLNGSRLRQEHQSSFSGQQTLRCA